MKCRLCRPKDGRDDQDQESTLHPNSGHMWTRNLLLLYVTHSRRLIPMVVNSDLPNLCCGSEWESLKPGNHSHLERHEIIVANDIPLELREKMSVLELEKRGLASRVAR